MSRLSALTATGALCAIAFISASAQATKVHVQINGSVEFALPTSGPLAPVNPGDAAMMKFDVDSNVFVNSPNFPTRGYNIIPGSFSLKMGSVTIGFANPMPPGNPPYFVLRNNDPAVDGFVVSRNVDFPVGVPTSVSNNIVLNFLRTFNSGTALISLNILDALGNYTFADLSVFNWTLDQGPGTPVGMIYESMSITLACPADLDGNGAVDAADLSVLLGAWGTRGSSSDLNGDGVVDAADLSVLLGAWGACG